MDETGVTTELGRGALPSRSKGESSEKKRVLAEVRAICCRWQRCSRDCKHGSGEGITGTCVDRKPSWDLAKRRERQHGKRILQMEYRGRQPSFGARVGENPGNHEGRAEAHLSKRSCRTAPSHPNRHSRRRVRQGVGRESGCGRRILRRTELD